MKTTKSSKNPTPKNQKPAASKPEPGPAAPLKPEAKLEMIEISTIIRDDSTQVRHAMNKATVEKYAAVLRNGGRLPPPVVFEDRLKRLWLADGHHTIAAHETLGRVEIECELRIGSQPDAWTHGVRTNGRHGLDLSNEDKAKIAATAVANKALAALSNRKLAEALDNAVSFEMLRKARNARKAGAGTGGVGRVPAARRAPHQGDNVVSQAKEGPNFSAGAARLPMTGNAAEEPYICVADAIDLDRIAEIEGGVTLAPYVEASLTMGTPASGPEAATPQPPQPGGVLPDLSGFVIESLRAAPDQPLAFWVSAGMIAVGVRRVSGITVYHARILSEIAMDDEGSAPRASAAGSAP